MLHALQFNLQLGRRADDQMGRWSDGHMGRWADDQMGRWSDGQMGRWADGGKGRWVDGQVGRWPDGHVSRWADGQMGRWGRSAIRGDDVIAFGCGKRERTKKWDTECQALKSISLSNILSSVHDYVFIGASASRTVI